MDVHVHNSRTPHYSLNDFLNPHSEDDMQSLSLEERECILFFEETIGSLEEELEKEGGSFHLSAETRPASYVTQSLGDYDIIDLVHTTPDVKHADVTPDIQRLMVSPAPRPEMNFSSAAEEGGHRPPHASTHITGTTAENQADSSLSPSSLLQRRCSLEFPQKPSAKHGPPTHAKPTHLPDNISMLLGSREHIPHSIASEAVSVQEHRTQMLANFTGPAHPLEGGEPLCIRNLPTRSVSFRQPTPEQCRMEALSKLGLAQRRAQSVLHPSSRDPNNDSSVVRMALKSNSTPTHTSNASSSVHEPITANVANASVHMARIPNTASPANVTVKVRERCQSNNTADKQKSSHLPALTSAEITHSDFNSYGGKSIMLNPTTSFKSEFVPYHKPEAPDVQLNSFGGWSRVMTPSVMYRDELNHGSSSYSQTLLNTHQIAQPTNQDARSKNESMSLNSGSRCPDENIPAREVRSSHSKPPQTSAHPPSTAPRPPDHSTPLSPTRPRPSSPELRRKPAPKASFRTQGITVQFSGKGATDDTRRDALRKLGLLRGTP